MQRAKLSLILILAVGLLFSGSLTLMTQAQGPGDAIHSPEDIVNDYPEYELTEDQVEDLEFIYEEEKLARDLYARLDEEWDLPAFENISQSEDQHMDALEALFDKYDLETPDTAAGEYNNTELAEAYDDFLEKGLESEEAALELGRELEEKDIEDLEEFMSNATPDFEAVYANLKAGSENHLESFNNISENNGGNQGTKGNMSNKNDSDSNNTSGSNNSSGSKGNSGSTNKGSNSNSSSGNSNWSNGTNGNRNGKKIIVLNT